MPGPEGARHLWLCHAEKIMKLNYGKTFLLGFGFFMTLDNIAALLIQPPVGAWSDKLRTPIGRRMPFILVGAPIGAVALPVIQAALAEAHLPFNLREGFATGFRQPQRLNLKLPRVVIPCFAHAVHLSLFPVYYDNLSIH
jgi:hypothetical protein